MLLHCYRCHPDILKIPNELFYHNALIPAADHLVSHNMRTYTKLPKQGFPIIFHGIEGENIRESTSPSWFNIAEIEQVWYYIQDLVNNHNIPSSDIAIITPYHKQVMKITQLLRNSSNNNKYHDIAIGSCEKMQGQERRVIIISTVRSSPEFLNEDIYYNIGFVANPKRFNVAITRAKALLIIVGNPHVLGRDKHWGSMLRYCIERGGYTGCPAPVLDSEGGVEYPFADPLAGESSDAEQGGGTGGGDSGDEGDLVRDAIDQVNMTELQQALSGLQLQNTTTSTTTTATTVAPVASTADFTAEEDNGWERVEEADWGGLEN